MRLAYIISLVLYIFILAFRKTVFLFLIPFVLVVLGQFQDKLESLPHTVLDYLFFGLLQFGEFLNEYLNERYVMELRKLLLDG